MGFAKPGRFWAKRTLGVGLFIAACVLLGQDFVRNLRPARTYILDFAQEWTSARNYFHGLPIYSPLEQSYREYLGYERRPGEFFLERNAHPPTSVLLVLPLAGLDYPDAFLAWSLVSLAALFASAWVVMRQLALPVSLWTFFPVATLLLVCNPFRQQMNQGQLNLLLLLLLTAVWAADRTGRPVWAGVWLGLATAVKLFPGFLFLYFVARRQGRTLFAGGLSFLVLMGVTVLVLGADTYRDYVEEVMPVVAAYRDWWPNASLLGFWAKLFDGRAGKVVPVWHSPGLMAGAYLASAALVVAVVGWVALRAKSRAEQDLAFSLTLTGMLLVSPITWDHYFTLLFLPLAILWTYLPRVGLERTAFWVLVVFLWLSPLVYWWLILGARMDNWQSLTARPAQTVTALSVQTYALLGLFLLLLRAGRPARPDPGY
jgi:hypothetical protein